MFLFIFESPVPTTVPGTQGPLSDMKVNRKESSIREPGNVVIPEMIMWGNWAKVLTEGEREVQFSTEVT